MDSVLLLFIIITTIGFCIFYLIIFFVFYCRHKQNIREAPTHRATAYPQTQRETAYPSSSQTQRETAYPSSSQTDPAASQVPVSPNVSYYPERRTPLDPYNDPRYYPPPGGYYPYAYQPPTPFYQHGPGVTLSVHSGRVVVPQTFAGKLRDIRKKFFFFNKSVPQPRTQLPSISLDPGSPNLPQTTQQDTKTASTSERMSP